MMKAMCKEMRKRLEGLYVVVAPDTPPDKIEKALRGGADIFQIWMGAQADPNWARQVSELARRYQVPVLVNNDVKLAAEIGADGVHTDDDRLTPQEIRKALSAQALVGVTCGADLDKVRWAEKSGADYISFCSIFPSSSVDECEIVPLETIKAAKRLVKIPVFASGGITLQNAPQVLAAGADGLALISAIFHAPDPEQAARSFKRLLRRKLGIETSRTDTL
ncbi:thiamine phosphate synthase [Candidatus Acetothermia bacterium]|jgi:thiamine-phosphate pyrophosphorylase|nr:thiamine phosphate synthase [Candidatus Acetothermia bacterium]MCI2431048.1 thiamine phosphate synthase [Candidatus Acetothermia bacterium]MCI2436944.1 thiamine phosphate synthase [Candidatus Acetothermia bacterium]